MSRELGYYKGYKLKEDDGDILVIKNGKTIISCENEHEAYDYIDNLMHHDHTRSISLKYCISIRYKGNSREYLVGNRGLVPAGTAKEKDVRIFTSKKEAEKIYNVIKKSLDDHYYNIVLYR